MKPRSLTARRCTGAQATLSARLDATLAVAIASSSSHGPTSRPGCSSSPQGFRGSRAQTESRSPGSRPASIWWQRADRLAIEPGAVRGSPEAERAPVRGAPRRSCEAGLLELLADAGRAERADLRGLGGGSLGRGCRASSPRRSRCGRARRTTIAPGETRPAAAQRRCSTRARTCKTCRASDVVLPASTTGSLPRDGAHRRDAASTALRASAAANSRRLRERRARAPRRRDVVRRSRPAARRLRRRRARSCSARRARRSSVRSRRRAPPRRAGRAVDGGTRRRRANYGATALQATYEQATTCSVRQGELGRSATEATPTQDAARERSLELTYRRATPGSRAPRARPPARPPSSTCPADAELLAVDDGGAREVPLVRRALRRRAPT